MRVGVDAHMLGTRETGNETYVRGLLHGLAELDGGPEVIAYVGAEPGMFGEPRVTARRLGARGSLARLLVELPRRSRADGVDVLHSTYVAPLRSAAAGVLMVHDITYLTHPAWLSARDRWVLRVGVARSVRRAARVVVPTEAVRAEVVAAYGLEVARVHAIHHGPGPAAQALDVEEARALVARLGIDPAPPYVLAVGGATPRKNLVALVGAFAAVRDFDGVLVLAGAALGSQAEAVRAAAPPLGRRVVVTPHVGDRTLAALYSLAAAVAVPSLDEGFGLTALEAMWHGVRLAVSDVPALREVCGDAAAYMDPGDGESMAAAIAEMLAGDDAERAARGAAGRSRASGFSWAKSAAAHVEVFRQAAGERSEART